MIRDFEAHRLRVSETNESARNITLTCPTMIQRESMMAFKVALGRMALEVLSKSVR